MVRKYTLLLVAAFALVMAACGDSESDGGGEHERSGAADASLAYNASDEIRTIYASLRPGLKTALRASPAELSDRVRSEIGGARQATARLVWAADLPPARWDIDYEPLMLDSELEHLQQIDTLALLLMAEADAAVEQGETGRAAEAAVALVNLGRHVGDRLTVEGMKGYATLRAAAFVVIKHSDRWGSAERQKLNAALGGIDQNDPFGLRANLAAERDWADRRGFAAPDASAYDDARRRTAEHVAEAKRAMQ